MLWVSAQRPRSQNLGNRKQDQFPEETGFQLSGSGQGQAASISGSEIRGRGDLAWCSYLDAPFRNGYGLFSSGPRGKELSKEFFSSGQPLQLSSSSARGKTSRNQSGSHNRLCLLIVEQ